LETYLSERKTAIVQAWFDRVVETYPPDTSLFLKNQKDPFANPVGSTTLTSLKSLLDELIKPQSDPAILDAALDPIIRIRAVQAMFSPAQAAGFPLFLKHIIRNDLKRQLTDPDLMKSLMDFEKRIDDLTLMAFNIYMKCREAVFRLRTNEERERIYRAFSRAGLVTEIPGEPPER